MTSLEYPSLVRRDPEFAESQESGDVVFRQSRECRPFVPARRLFCLITVFDFLAAVIIWLLYANVSTIFWFVQLGICTFPAKNHTRNSSRTCRILGDRASPYMWNPKAPSSPYFLKVSSLPFPKRSCEVTGPTAESGPASEAFEVKQWFSEYF